MLELQKSPTYYNDMQRKLVVESEKIWYAGIRGKNLSGRSCEILLRDFIREEIPDVNAHEGVVLLSKKKGSDLKSEEYSPQIDIILYKKEPVYKYKDTVAVYKDQVVLAIEVKKWTSPTDLIDPNKFNKAIEKMKNIISKPVFFVTFRHFGTGKKYRWTSADHVKRECKADKSYVFGAPTKNKMPWRVVPADTWLYSGELQKLVNDIKNEIRKHDPDRSISRLNS